MGVCKGILAWYLFNGAYFQQGRLQSRADSTEMHQGIVAGSSVREPLPAPSKLAALPEEIESLREAIPLTSRDGEDASDLSTLPVLSSKLAELTGSRITKTQHPDSMLDAEGGEPAAHQRLQHLLGTSTGQQLPSKSCKSV